jgi:hypothetical protein
LRGFVVRIRPINISQPRECNLCKKRQKKMRLNILVDDNRTTLEASVIGESTEKPTPDPSQLADEESPETAEYLVIGHPPGSGWRHVQHGAGLAVLAAVALTTWLLPSSSSDETDLLPLISSAAASQEAVPAPGWASAGGYATPLDPLTAYAQFCQSNPTRRVSTTPTALRDIGYVQFCQNSPSVCIVAKPD